MDTIQIIYTNEQYFKSFHEALSVVAQEKIFIEMIEAMEFQKLFDFQKKLIAKNHPCYFAVLNDQVVGWADISSTENPRLSHRGFLGMGLLPKFRGQGIGSELLNAVIEHARKVPFEKIELSVYTSNLPAIKLYQKYGFETEGTIKHYRKLDGKYFDCLSMAKFL
jgi:ribosomal protein S18 acetylase RimI-like enzyme